MSAPIDIGKRIAELQLELEACAERDGQRYSMTRRGMVETLKEIITSPPERSELGQSLCEVRYVGKEGRMVAAFPDKHRCMDLLTKLFGWAEPTQMHVSVDPFQSLLNSIRARVEYPQAKWLSTSASS